MAEAIPSPSSLPILGNALDLDAEYPMTSLTNLASRYGEPEAKVSGQPAEEPCLADVNAWFLQVKYSSSLSVGMNESSSAATTFSTR